VAAADLLLGPLGLPERSEGSGLLEPLEVSLLVRQGLEPLEGVSLLVRQLGARGLLEASEGVSLLARQGLLGPRGLLEASEVVPLLARQGLWGPLGLVEA
jgi:hypothetical protein